MGKRFAIGIGVAATGVMALGTQTAAAVPDVVKYDTELTLYADNDDRFVYMVLSKVRKCMEGRRVVLFKQRSGADRRIGADRSERRSGRGEAVITTRKWRNHVVYAKVQREVHDEFVCGGDRSERHDDRHSFTTHQKDEMG